MVGFRPFLFVLGLLCLLFQGCLPAFPSLPQYTKKKPEVEGQLQVRWFRRTFYKLYQLEKKKKDYGDRLRRFVRLHPQLARLTFQQNRIQVLEHQKKGKELGTIQMVLLQMNALIRMTLSLSEPIYLEVRPRQR